MLVRGRVNRRSAAGFVKSKSGIPAAERKPSCSNPLSSVHPFSDSFFLNPSGSGSSFSILFFLENPRFLPLFQTKTAPAARSCLFFEKSFLSASFLGLPGTDSSVCFSTFFQKQPKTPSPVSFKGEPKTLFGFSFPPPFIGWGETALGQFLF